MRRICRPSPALVVACLALLVALGGTSVAAVSALAPNSVGTSQLKDNAVVTAKIKSGGVGSSDIAANAVVAAKIASNAVTAAKIAGNAVTGAKVQDGSLAAADLAAPTDGLVRFVNGPVAVPATLTTLANLSIAQAGNYVLISKAYVIGTADSGAVTCRLEAGGDFDVSQATPSGALSPQTITNLVGHVFTAAGSVDFRCSRGGLGDASANFIKIAAIRVANLTNTG
jgi:hypothetical protein